MQFKTLDYAVKVLQTHQTDTTTVCPLLEELGNADTTATRILELYDQVHGGLHVFSAGGGRTPSTTSASASSSSVLVGRTKPHGRSANVKKDCRNRDGNRSVLSQFMEEEGLQVAHIIPYSASGEKADMFWPFIEMFLKKNGVTALKGLVLGPQGTTDHLRNVMLLSSTEHQAFDTHKWELVPVLEMLPYNSNTCSEPAWASSARDLLASAAISRLPLAHSTTATSPMDTSSRSRRPTRRSYHSRTHCSCSSTASAHASTSCGPARGTR
ncbi:hypothetical protein P167DRAFT_173107 [Morchella conica CCBAS932]|uniref:HNH nuclease domain-containing protein n=1 Tax=Morchella conica CCBAS932 TaxID=1392247 RepID=A0A3N4KRT0_9PEZI|nr:hypothetical protein P167DRAFT_173107 [Morchella conica CCBAS932]